MSEEVAVAAGDLAYWKKRAETAEADAAALRTAVKRMSDLVGTATSYPEIVATAHAIAADALTTPHPGAALLAELVAARGLAAAVRYELADGFGVDTLGPALDAHDQAVKVREP